MTITSGRSVGAWFRPALPTRTQSTTEPGNNAHRNDDKAASTSVDAVLFHGWSVSSESLDRCHARSMKLTSPVSSPTKAGDPITRASQLKCESGVTGCPAFAGHDTGTNETIRVTTPEDDSVAEQSAGRALSTPGLHDPARAPDCGVAVH